MKIIGLQAESFRKLAAVELEVSEGESLIQISGKNGAGKSSILDAIWETLGGKGVSKGNPVKHGEKEAQVEVTLKGGEETLIATRRWKADGKSSIKLVTKTFTDDGDERVYTLGSPQKVLDDLLETVAFDPVRLIKASDKDRAEILRKASGLDLTEIDEERKKVYDTRTDARRLLEIKEKDTENWRGRAPAEDPGPVESIKMLMDLQKETTEKIQAAEVKKDRRADAAIELNGVKEKLAELQIQKETLEKELNTLPDTDTLTKEVDTLSAELEEIVKKARGIEGHNTAAAAWKNYQEAVEAEGQQKTVWENLDNEYKALGVKRADLIKAADMPLEGLELNEAGETVYKGVVFDQCSQGEQLRIATVLAMSMKPGLRVIQIRDGSLLDSKAKAQLAGIAHEYGFQVWLEMVDESGDVGIYLEDGEIVYDNR